MTTYSVPVAAPVDTGRPVRWSPRDSVVILRLRGIDEVGLTFVAVLDRYLTDLERHGSTLWVVISSERVLSHLKAGGLYDRLGDEGIYQGSEWIGEATRTAVAAGGEWVEAHSPRA